jgi:hypothetical protein
MLINAKMTKASNASVPMDLNSQLEIAYPKGKTLVSAPCQLGSSNIESFGLVLQKKLLSLNKSENPLVPVIATKSLGQWQLKERPKRFDYALGGGKDFLGDFWDKSKGFTGGLEVRCADPLKDMDISLQANGAFVGNFFNKLKPGTKHLCYQADNAYNSWVCATVNPSNSLPEQSFIQMNAD